MLIGELSRRTGVSERLIRYYEDQGLLESRRRANGYREYGDDAELTVARIRALLAAGLPTRSIARLLPCAAGVDALRPCPGTREVLHERLATEELPALADDMGLDAGTRAALDAYVAELRDWMAGILKWHRETARYDRREPVSPRCLRPALRRPRCG